MNEPKDDPEATLPPDPLGSTIPAPPPEFELPERPAWFYTMRTPVDWDGFASEALDEE